MMVCEDAGARPAVRTFLFPLQKSAASHTKSMTACAEICLANGRSRGGLWIAENFLSQAVPLDFWQRAHRPKLMLDQHHAKRR